MHTHSRRLWASLLMLQSSLGTEVGEALGAQSDRRERNISLRQNWATVGKEGWSVIQGQWSILLCIKYLFPEIPRQIS